MKSDTKRDYAQLGAMAGVVLSLMFVGYEIRQNTQIARAAAVQATVEQIIQWQTQSASDENWIRIIAFLREGGSYAELSNLDQVRYGWIVAPTVRITENRFRQMKLGVISKEDLGIAGGTSNPSWFQSPHFLDWWRSTDRTTAWAPDFLEFFEEEILGIR